MTQQTHVISDPDGYPDHLERWLSSRQPRSRRPTPPALVVARCVLAVAILAVLFGLPPLLRGVGSALG